MFELWLYRTVLCSAVLCSTPQAPVAAPTAAAPARPSPAGEFTDYPLSEEAMLIAQQLTASKQNVPHYYLTIDLK